MLMQIHYHQYSGASPSHMGTWSTTTWWWKRDSCSWGATSSAERGPWQRESGDPWSGLRGSCCLGYGLPVNWEGWSCRDCDLPSTAEEDISVSWTTITATVITPLASGRTFSVSVGSSNFKLLLICNCNWTYFSLYNP